MEEVEGQRARPDTEAQKAKDRMKEMQKGEKWGDSIYKLQKSSLVQRLSLQVLINFFKKVSVLLLEAFKFQYR